jgi:hypothetical protein
MVEHTCNRCGKTFNKKSSYIDHTEHKKKPCKAQQQNNIKVTPIPPNEQKIPANLSSNMCKYCNRLFTRNDSLKKHLTNRCKVKKLQDEEKENIFKELLNKEEINNNFKAMLLEQNKLIMDKLEKLKKQNEEYKNHNKELEKQIKQIIKKNVTKNNCNNNTQNIQINNINIVDHGKEDFEKINYKVFTEAMLKTGPLLFEKLTKGIHFNPDYPENHNIYISDINREKVMIYNNKRWILENYDNLYPNFISRILEFGYTKEKFMDECFENGKLNQTGIDIIKQKMQWIRLIDDYTEEEIEEDIKMIEFRKRHDKKELEKRVKNQIKKTMYNNKEMVIENYDRLYNEDMKKELLTNE